MTMLLIACAALSLTATDAGVAKYVATPRAGADLDDGRLRRVSVARPARCESDNGRRWDWRLAVDLTGDLAFKEGRFRRRLPAGCPALAPAQRR